MKLKGTGKAIFICAALARLAGAGTIVQSSGNSLASVPLGYYAPYGTATVYAVSWSQNSSYTDVAVFANLFNSGGGGTVDYTLATASGPGTSFLTDGIVDGSVTTPANPTDVELFQLPVLGPGTYYLVLDSPTAGSAWQYNFPFQSNDTTAPGASYLGSSEAQYSAIDSNYTPGSTFSSIGYPVEFSVTGTAAATAPEPTFDAAIGLMFLALAAVLRRHRAFAARRGERG